MRDLVRDLQAVDMDPAAEPACCPGGTCGPIFETPLLELAFIRIRDLFGGRKTPAVETTADPPLDHQLPTAQGEGPAPITPGRMPPHG